MSARDDIANVLAFAGDGLKGHTWATLSDASRTAWCDKADALLASPVYADLIRAAKAEAFLEAVAAYHEHDPDHCGGECFRWTANPYRKDDQ